MIVSIPRPNLLGSAVKFYLRMKYCFDSPCRVLLVMITIVTVCGGAAAGAPDVAGGFPEDDGYACALFFGAEIQGTLNHCGCPQKPEGGFGWRMGYSNMLAARGGGIPTLQVDAGYFFSEMQMDAREQNKWVLRVYNELNMAAANLTYHDLPYAEHLFEAGVYRDAKESNPMVGRLISANIIPRDNSHVRPPPYLIHTLKSPRIPKRRQFRIGFVGLTDSYQGRASSSVFVIRHPLAAAHQIVPIVRQKCDMVVLLAYLPSELVEQIVKQVPGIDLVILSNQIDTDRPPVQIHQTTVACARSQTRSLGEALVYLKQDGSLDHLRVRMVPLDDRWPEDPLARKLTEQANEAVTRFRQEYSLKQTPPAWK